MTPLSAEFKPPVVKQSLGSATLKDYSPKFLAETYFLVAKKSFATDTLSLSVSDYMDTSVAKYLNRRFSDTLVSYDGFELHPDYPSSVYSGSGDDRTLFCYYPLYVMNESPSSRVFPGKDNYAFGIQEALDSAGNWRPIEGKGFDFCGNGHWNVAIKPKEYLVILLPKYRGSFQTKLRVRLKIGDMVYVSKAFNGSINYQQFVIEKGSYFDVSNKVEMVTAIQWQFYGGIPLGKSFTSNEGPAVYAAQPD